MTTIDNPIEYTIFLGMVTKDLTPLDLPFAKVKASVIVGEAFEGFTVTDGEGHWQGASENSYIFEIVGSVADREKVCSVAGKLRDEFKQQAVLVTEQELKGAS